MLFLQEGKVTVGGEGVVGEKWREERGFGEQGASVLIG